MSTARFRYIERFRELIERVELAKKRGRNSGANGV